MIATTVRVVADTNWQEMSITAQVCEVEFRKIGYNIDLCVQFYIASPSFSFMHTLTTYCAKMVIFHDAGITTILMNLDKKNDIAQPKIVHILKTICFT